MAALFIVFVVFICKEAPAQSEAVNEHINQTLSWEEQVKDEPVIFIAENETLTLNDDWSYTTTEYRKFKINKEEAKTLGELKFYYNKSREKIKGIKACTITPDGNKHQYTKIQDLSVYESEPMYSDIRMKIISLPKVSVGSIIEYEVTTVARQGPIKHEFLEETQFDIKTPSKEMNVVYDFPKQLPIQYKEFNLKYKPTITHSDKRIAYAWHCVNLYEKRPAVPEEYVPAPSPESIENAIQFSSMRDWPSVSGWYLSLINKNSKTSSAIEKTTKELTQDYTAVRDKARVIKEYIDKNFRYVSMLFGENTYEPHPTTEVFKNRYGDCKDLSLLCMAMLKAAGVNSHMALFNDFFSISDPQYDLPMPFLFNHALLIIEDEPELLTFVARYLGDLGYEVVSATDGIEGLNLARQVEPTLILLDVMLPKLNGFTISRLLKFDEQFKHIPI
ncbi:MAG: DUF3857 domain-containing protein, partial [Nanoarchaeota archaeon]